jgi:ankyrin repeat protein
LAEAIKRDHYTAVTVLLKANAAQLRRHIDEPISQCANALQFAVAYRRSKIVDLLLREGANVNARGAVFDQETTAQAAFATNYVLKIATINQSRDLVELLLAKGARVNATCRPWAVPSGSTSLGAALQSRRVDIARLLLDAGADINSEFTLTTEATVDMYKLLSAAVKDGAEDESQILLQLGGYDHRCWPAARWYIRYDAERSLLEQAVLFRHCGIVRLLLEHKVPVNDADGVNCNALSIAITLGELEIARLLLKYGANANMSPSGTWKTPLCAAVTRQSEDMTELLLRNGAKPDLSPKWLPTALHIAVGLGSEALVRTLLWHGAEVARPFNNRTPISKAIQYGYANIAKVLFQAGAKATSSMLYDVIQIRTSSERELIIALIIEHGADLNAKEGYMERGALEEAVAVGNPRVVEILLRFKPTLDYSLLITAVRSNNSGIVKLLLRAGITAQSSLLYEHIGGASKTARLSEDFVGRESLSESGAIIQFMLEHGVDVDAREGRYKQTALELAIEKGNSEAIDILLRFAPQIKPTTLERASAFKGPEYPAIMRLLIDHCVRFATGKKLRSTALKFAARTGNLSALQSLLQSGTRVNSEIWNAARTCRHGTDSPHEQAVLQLLHDHEAATDDSGRHLFPISLRTTSVATERTGLLAHDFAEIENEQDDSVPVSQVDEPLACIALFG